MPTPEELADDLAVGFALAMEDDKPAEQAVAEPEPEPAKAEPEPAKAEPEPVKVESEPAKTEPDPAVIAAQEELRKTQARNAELEAEKLEREKSPPELSAAEKQTIAEAEAAIAAVEKDWPDVAKAMRVLLDKQKQEMESVFEKKMQEVQTAVTTQVAPAVQTAQQAAYDKFMAPIIEAHPDHAKYTTAPDGQKSELEKWIETLPAHKQYGCMMALDKGTSQDAVEVLNDFKAAKGLTAAPDTTAQRETEAARAKEDELKQRRLAKMEGVRSTPTNRADNVADPDDFAGGFAEALKTGM